LQLGKAADEKAKLNNTAQLRELVSHAQTGLSGESALHVVVVVVVVLRSLTDVLGE
jgi:hypothetical protein